MADQPNDKRPHLFPKQTSESQAFTAHSGRAKKVTPELPRAQHGAALRAQLQHLKPMADNAADAQKERGLESGLGLQIQFVSQPDVDMVIESLANEPKAIELLSV